MELVKVLLRQAGGGQERGQQPAISGYEIQERLGVGGFGAVYLARQKKDNEPVAIKVMLSKVAVDERSRALFLREVKQLRPLKHPHVVSLIDSGSAGGTFYFVMEYCDGGSVDGLMARRGGKLSVGEALPVMIQALDGLAYIHGHNVVHRDLSPSNILLTASEQRWCARISDLGLAKNFQKAGFSGMTITGSYAGRDSSCPVSR